MIQLVNRASESHKAYIFQSKVYQEAFKIVKQILARNYKDSHDGNLRTLHISYMLDNGRDDNSLDAIHRIKVKGLKKKENLHKEKKVSKVMAREDDQKKIK